MFRLLKVASTLVLVMSLSACQGEAEDPDEPGVPTLRVTASPPSINTEGQFTTLRVTAEDANDNPGTGQVTFTAPAGVFANDSRTLTLDLNGGQASTTWRCVRAQDTGCQVSVTLSAAWNDRTSDTTIELTGASPDSGTPDSGTPDSGTPDAGQEIPQVGEPANIIYQPAGAKEQLGIKSSNLDTSTPVSFLVVDLKQQPVPNVAVAFEVRGVGGAVVTPTSATTDANGRVSTTLLAGDEVGIATVRATVTSTNPDLTAASLGTPIVGARPSDEGFVVECEQINLAANATATPPRKDLTTECTAQLVDRFRNPVGLKTSVSWYSEAGSIDSPVSTGGAIRGRVTTTFQTAGKWPPAEIPDEQLKPGEPSDNGYNPRDMLVTVIAVTSGEEAFYDGSGVSNGEKNGTWDPGEWFVDLPEPFIDENDNQQYDLGEPFIDTERQTCPTAQTPNPPREPKNRRWDGPNGCWDDDIQLWRSTHIVYSGFTGARFTFAPDPTPGSYDVAKGSAVTFSMRVSDGYFNPVSPDGAFAIAALDATKGTVSVLDPNTNLNKRGYGMSIIQERVRVVESASPPGYQEDGPCDTTDTVPVGASAKQARCMWTTRFANFTAGNSFRVRILGVPATDTTPPAPGTVTVTVGNAYSEASDSRGAIIR